MSFSQVAVSSIHNAANTTFTENGAIIREDTEHTGVTAFHKLTRDHTRNFMTGIKLHKLNYFNSKTSTCRSRRDRIKTESFIKSSCKMNLETSTSIESVHKYYGDMIRDGIEKITTNKNDTEIIRDAFILPFYKRCFTKTVQNEDGTEDKHTGEGERLLSYQMILELHSKFPQTVYDMIRVMPTYGYWGDLFAIWQLLCKREAEDDILTTEYTEFKLHILYTVITQIRNDIFNKKQEANISLLAKWIPREGKSKDKSATISFILENGTNITYSVYTALAIMYSNPMNFAAPISGYIHTIRQNLMKQYTSKTLSVYRMKFRKAISSLNKYMKTFEIAACGNKWSSIIPQSVPSRAMHKYQKAYLNETNEQMTAQQECTGNRFPDNPDRVNARNILIEHLLSGDNIKISGVDPHDIMKAYRNATSTSQRLMAQKQWDNKIEEVFTSFVETEGLDKDNIESLKTSRMCNIIPMMDVSGSMEGLPIEVSVGLGLFICGLQRRCGIQEIAIAFHETPFVFDFTGMTLQEQIDYVFKNVGYTTNFESAVDLLLDAIKTSGEHKDLIVFTDGQFDKMHQPNKGYKSCNKPLNNWTTCHHRILQKVASLGLSQAPNIIYWNLRANTQGVQTSAHHPGVQMLQGYSPVILKFALFGGENLEDEITVSDDNGTNTTIKVNAKTPYETYRDALDQECFGSIRDIISQSTEGVLSYIN